MGKIIVTITPPTPNGNLHLGHISGPFLAADVFARISRLQGHEVVFLCYSDDYQSYVARKARELGTGRFELAAKNADAIQQTLSLSDISVDWFLKAYNNACFREAVTFFYEQAYQKGAIVRKTDTVPYSEEDQVYGYEAFGRGTCNYCGHESDPSQCEHCAEAPDLHEMGAITSVISQKPMVWRPQEREFLDLSLHQADLLAYYRQLPLRGYLREFLESILSRDNLYWPIDRPGEYGIDIEANGQTHTIHTWFSGIAGYWAAFKEYAYSIGNPQLVDDFWYDEQTDLVHFLGFDCSYSHAIIYPSLLYNCEGVTRNIHFFPNRFLKLEGKDFSTSRGIAIWVNDILQEAPLDAVRFFLALHSPEEETTNFEKEKFNEWTFGFFLPVIKTLEAYTIPAGQGFSDKALTQDDRDIVFQLIHNWKKHASREAFSIRQLATVLNELLRYIQVVPDTEQERIQTMAQLYAVLASPIHPGLSEKLSAQLGNVSAGVMQWILELHKPVAA